MIMGRFTTIIAAYAANVDNLPPKDKLPNISFWDSVLPDCVYNHPETKKEKKVRKQTLSFKPSL